ncbi:hypothetical protein [Paenibacillus sp. MMS18-CY102]|uniref:hypothetical protein n=1 Tax=Paenibacillus sp. MMS18-CY102 TaxID=2682849 RepID=UPI0013651996|nr:hypothetical protein [Paenibacillus sp. MMS18-CY102]MWC29823.1 hypothetical protein [Paenibacillus sp. MMS18-CY102]
MKSTSPINSKVIRKHWFLQWTIKTIRNIIDNNRELAFETKKKKEEYKANKSSANADRLAHLYYGWHEEAFKSDARLDARMKNQIEKSSELNDAWIKEAHENDEEDYRLNQKDWLTLLDRLETGTVEFLNNNQINSIEELWLTRAGK